MIPRLPWIREKKFKQQILVKEEQNILAIPLIDIRIRTIRKKGVIYVPGQSASHVILRKGQVVIYSLDARGNRAIKEFVDAEAVLGEEAFIGEVHSNFAEALTECSVQYIRPDVLKTMLQESPTLRSTLLQSLTKRIRTRYDRMYLFLTPSVPQRVAGALLELGNGTNHIPPGITQKFLAEIVGARRESVNLALMRFKKLGVVDWNHDIMDHDKLRYISRLGIPKNISIE